MTAPLFSVGPGALDDLGEGEALELTGAEAHHAATVIRLREGQEVLVGDRRGAWARAVAEAISGDLVSLRIAARGEEPMASPRIVLAQALAKDGRDEDAVESATELGVDGVVPWQADRSIARWKGPKVDKGRRKWANVIERAAKQSRRARWPDLEQLSSTADLAGRCRETGVTPFVLHEDATEPLATTALPTDGEVLLVVGPEGGISPEELERLTDVGARPVRLGTHVLRASTAGPAAIAVISGRGRWR